MIALRLLPTLVLSIVLSILFTGCGKETPPQPAASGNPQAPAANKGATPGAARGGAFQKPIVEGLKKAGLSVGEFEPTAAKPYQARACSRGEVSKLDVMTCQYDSEAAAKQASTSLATFVAGASGGAVRQSGAITLAVADRTKVDLRGQTLNKLLKSFTALGVR